MKSIKILTLGNSYSNDAYAWLYEIFKSAGYGDVVLGHLLNGGCNINNHWSNVDDDPENDYGGCYVINDNGASSSHSASEALSLREIYIRAFSQYPWDFVVIQHGPKHIEKRETYTHLRELLDLIKENLTSKETRFIYHMIWKYNDNVKGGSTAANLADIYDITHNIVLKNPEFCGVIPSVTMRQNIMSSYLTDKDISRDYGHMSLGFGRYALGLLWYSYLTGDDASEIGYVPTLADVRPALLEKYEFDGVDGEKMKIALEAIKNALASPYAITQSVYTEGVASVTTDGGSIDDHIKGGERIE